ncbi:TonB family protein [candidate division WOR-3 bacterium]|uniref:TonB family protein n=1 Tax=candidate division WOR-3 bacterium TaxID=2052148 RepID=A0A9D5K927_UNCW3|nr:TonB family protein [candidate division WOR-3 bacterium]MBD3363865.1 TonB family protein [candidate division WOR-3 bacterium]
MMIKTNIMICIYFLIMTAFPGATVYAREGVEELLIIWGTAVNIQQEDGSFQEYPLVDTTRIDVTGWQPGERFVDLSGFRYPWNGESVIDYESELNYLNVNGKCVGLSLPVLDTLMEIDTPAIVTVSAGVLDIEELKHFPNVVALELGRIGLEDRDIDLSAFLHLRSFELRPSYLWTEKEHMKVIRYLEPLSELRELRLTSINMTASDTRRLSNLKDLIVLDLSNTSLNCRKLRFLINLENIEEFDLSYTNVDDKVWRWIAKAPSLEVLDLNGTDISKVGSGNASLRDLNLSFTDVDDDGLKTIEQFQDLERLDLWGTPLTDEGLVHLKGLENLKYLDIGGTLITDKGLTDIAGLTNLEELILTYTGISDTGLEYLGSLENLKELKVEGTEITYEGLTRLATFLPELDITDNTFNIEGDLSYTDILESKLPGFPKRLQKKCKSPVQITIRFQVDAEGNFLPGMEVTSSSGFPKLDKNALKALRDYKFKPDKTKEPRKGIITFSFALGG